MPQLKEAVVNKFKKVNNINYEKDEVMISCGGKHALYNVAMTILNKGDEVILPVPFWVSFQEMIKVADGNVVLCKTDEKFKLIFEYIEEKITDKTKMLILNNPNNPSGAIIEKSELVKIAKVAVEKNIYVVSDEIYEFFIYGNKDYASIASLNDEMKNLTITTNSFSKSYAMMGFRIGYCGANKEIIKGMENLQSHSTSNPSNIGQMAAVEALNGPQDSLKIMIKEYGERRKFIYKKLNEIPGISCVEPEGAFYAFPNIIETGMKSSEFASRLLGEALVAVVPGVAFGSDDHVRLSYASSMQEIEKGLDRIDKWVKKTMSK